MLVTQDLPLRLRAGVIGLDAEEFRHIDEDLDWRGIVELDVRGEEIDGVYDQHSVHIDGAAGFPVHTGVILNAAGQSALGRVTEDGAVRKVN